MSSFPFTPVSRNSQIPLYHQVANDIRERISAGALEVGDQIPSEPELTRLYRASRMTIRQALSMLAREGLVSREPGRGSFVRGPHITAGPTRLTSFTSEMRAEGMAASSRVLELGQLAAPEDVAIALHLEVGDATVHLRRVRYGDGQPLGIQETWLPAATYPGLLEVNFATASLYAELEERYGSVIDEALETFIATILDRDAAELLHVPPATAGLAVERIGLDRGEPVEFTRSLMRGDRYRVQVQLRRPPEATKTP